MHLLLHYFLFQASLLVSLRSTELRHCETLLNYAMNFFQTEPVSLHPLLSLNSPYFISQGKALY